MASNFKIIRHQNCDNLHLKLLGDYDGTAADELINALMSCDPSHGKVFIHTSSLKSMHPFGAELFRLRSRRSIRSNVILVGQYAADIVFSESSLI